MGEAGDIACIFCGCCSAITFITYLIGMSISWIYTKTQFPENGLGLAASVVITIPVFTVIASIIIAGYLQFQEVKSCGYYISSVSIGLYGIFSTIGVGLLIASMVQASKHLESPAGPIVFGTFAAFFVAVSAISNFSTCCSILIIDNHKENDIETGN